MKAAAKEEAIFTSYHDEIVFLNQLRQAAQREKAAAKRAAKKALKRSHFGAGTHFPCSHSQAAKRSTEEEVLEEEGPEEEIASHLTCS